MAFHWTGAPEQPGADAVGLQQTFPTRVDAEAWLTGAFEDLADAGYTQVTLWEDDHVVYGPMGLLP